MRRREKSDKNEEDNKIIEEDLEEFNQKRENYNNRLNNIYDRNNNNIIDKNSNLNRNEILNNNSFNNNQFEFPEFLTKSENEQYLYIYMRMRERHFTDGAVFINIETDDIQDQNLELYDNKGINLEPPLINENLASYIDYFVESMNRDQFFKVNKNLIQAEDEKSNIIAKKRIKSNKNNKNGNLKKIQQKQEHYNNNNLDNNNNYLTNNTVPNILDIGRSTEDQIFAEFDNKLTEIINKTSNKVSLIFLFAQGLLAGVSLVNILLLYQYSDYNSFLKIYSYVVREIFNFTHALTFGSLTGNGIKFISAQNRFNFYMKNNVHFNSKKQKLKRSRIFSGIIFILFTIIFAIELYLVSYVPLILYSKYTTIILINQSTFQLFTTLYSVCNFIAIFNFVLNIFDVNVSENNKEDNVLSNYNIQDDNDLEETRENTLTNY